MLKTKEMLAELHEWTDGTFTLFVRHNDEGKPFPSWRAIFRGKQYGMSVDADESEKTNNTLILIAYEALGHVKNGTKPGAEPASPSP